MKVPTRVLLLLTILVTLPVYAQSNEAEGYQKQVQVTPLLKATVTSAGQPIAYPQIIDPEVTVLLVEIPPGTETGWHKHPFPCYAYILSGELSVDFEGGQTNHFTAGQAFAEGVNLRHNGKNIGMEPVRLVLFVTGEKDKPFTVH
jgi:quercetin dioxygenase-like cupin family protein